MNEVECDRCHSRWPLPPEQIGRYPFVQCHQCGRLIFQRRHVIQERLDAFLAES